MALHDTLSDSPLTPQTSCHNGSRHRPCHAHDIIYNDQQAVCALQQAHQINTTLDLGLWRCHIGCSKTPVDVAGDHPPTDDEEFLEFARSLSQPDIHDAIKQARPLSPISSYARTENLWRHYDQACACLTT